MRMYAAVTDFDWYRNLSSASGIDEVNFWKPGGKAGFKALEPGGLFLFKLKAPRNYIVGGGFFAHFTRLPCSLAWDAFCERNGAHSWPQFRAKVAQLKKVSDPFEDFVIGCILLEQPFFFPESDWIPAPGPAGRAGVYDFRTDLTHPDPQSMFTVPGPGGRVFVVFGTGSNQDTDNRLGLAAVNAVG